MANLSPCQMDAPPVKRSLRVRRVVHALDDVRQPRTSAGRAYSAACLRSERRPPYVPKLMEDAGLEPATACLQSRCSPI